MAAGGDFRAVRQHVVRPPCRIAGYSTELGLRMAESPVSSRPFDDRAFAQHLATLSDTWAAAMEAAGVDAVVVPAGNAGFYYEDDIAPPFRPNPNFAQWVPDDGTENSLLVYRPGEKPRLFFHREADFWYLPATAPEWAEAHFQVHLGGDADALAAAAIDEAAKAGRVGYIGPPEHLRGDTGQLSVNPEALVTHLYHARAYKSEFEIGAIRHATDIGVRGHLAARDAYFSGASELDTHLAYLSASRQTDAELPYPNIIAQNEHAGVLHYQHRDSRPPPRRRSFLIDAGGRHLGYASDITRTYSAERKDAFANLIDALDEKQRALIADIRPGPSYVDLHERMHRTIGGLLAGFGLVRCDADAAFETGITDVFFPHGLGHLLGLQTHDVGGRLTAPDGSVSPPPERYPALRLTRRIEARQVFTIEPGIYFIPQLLDQAAKGPHAGEIVWPRVESLLPCGGVRIEDNVLVTRDGAENLTRPAFHRLERAPA